MGHSGYTHTHSRCSSVHIERGEINHTLQKDKSPGAVAPSKHEREGGGGFGGKDDVAEMERNATAECRQKEEGKKRHRSDRKKSV